MFDEERYARNQRVRTIVKQRAGNNCELCGVEFTIRKGTLNSSLHHRKMRRHNGADSVSNLIYICNPCHKRIHKSADSEKAAGFVGSIVWTIPEITPIQLYDGHWVVLTEDGKYEAISEKDAKEIILWLVTFDPDDHPSKFPSPFDRQVSPRRQTRILSTC